MQYDISEIGEIRCQLTDDGEYEVSYYDSETFHQMGGYDIMTIEDIEEEFGSAIARDVRSECVDGREHSFEIFAYQNDEVDLNNPDQVNACAVKVLRHGEYFKGCRGFILTNGTVVYTEAEHSACTKVPGVKSTFHFISLGNIRILDHSIDIYKKPTPQQERVLWEVLDSYYGEVLYLDLENNGRMFSQQYHQCDPEIVMNDINRFFNTTRISEAKLRKLVSESIRKMLLKMSEKA